MKIKLSAHGVYYHQYHVVWIPKYRQKVLKGELKQYLEKGLCDIERFPPDSDIETFSIQVDQIHLVIVIPPTYAVSAIVGKIKANTSREIRKRFPWIKKVSWRNAFWSVGFFSSTVGGNEDVIKRGVEFQEKVATGKVQLDFGFEVPSAMGLRPWVSTSTIMIRATRGPSTTWKRFDTAATSKSDEIHDVWHRQAHRRSLRLLESFIGVVGFDYVITLKFQHFS